jgi:hypothetical protein
MKKIIYWTAMALFGAIAVLGVAAAAISISAGIAGAVPAEQAVHMVEIYASFALFGASGAVFLTVIKR